LLIRRKLMLLVTFAGRRDDDAGRIVTLAGERLCVSATDGST